MHVIAFDGELVMKKIMSSKNSKRAQGLKVDVEATKTLKTVGDQEAFYFYEAVGKPTGEKARNLSDFLERVKTAKSDSLVFHLQRGDFQNWVEKILGDSKLAKKLGRISPSNCDDVRMSICKTVENRIKELQESPAAILADESSAVLQPCS
jgi:hypothetical protein